MIEFVRHIRRHQGSGNDDYWEWRGPSPALRPDGRRLGLTGASEGFQQAVEVAPGGLLDGGAAAAAGRGDGRDGGAPVVGDEQGRAEPRKWIGMPTGSRDEPLVVAQAEGEAAGSGCLPALLAGEVPERGGAGGQPLIGQATGGGRQSAISQSVRDSIF